MARVKAWLIIGLMQTFISGSGQITVLPTVNATGGTFSNGSLSFDWSVAEMTQVHSVFQPSAIFTFGVLQPPIVLFAQPQNFPSGYVKVAPTITSNYVQLITQLPGPGNLEILLTDALGRVLQKSKSGVNGGYAAQLIFLSMLSPGAYFIQVRYSGSSGQNYVSVFKTLKL